MVAKLGWRSSIGVGTEATFGTAVAPTCFVEYNSESLKHEIDERLIAAINGGRQYTKRVTLNENVGGTVEFPLMPDQKLFLMSLNALCGGGNNYTVSTNTVVIGGSIGSYSYLNHTFIFRSTYPTNPSFTIRVNRDNTDTATTYDYKGCRINSLALQVGVGETANCTLDFMGVSEALANTIPTASFVTHNPFTFKGGTMKIGMHDAAPTTVAIESFSMNINNNLIEDRSIGSANRDRIEPGMQDITFEVTARYEDSTFYNYFLNGTRCHVAFTLYGNYYNQYTSLTENSPLTSTALPYIRQGQIDIEAHNVYFNGVTPNVGGADILKMTIPLRAICNEMAFSGLPSGTYYQVSSIISYAALSGTGVSTMMIGMRTNSGITV